MKRSWLACGIVGVSFVLAACSGGEGPAELPVSSGLEAQLEARYGAKFAVAREDGHAVWLSPLGDTRVVASSVVEAEAEALAVVRDFAGELGSPEAPALRVVRAERDELAGYSVRFVQLVPGTSIEIVGAGGSLDLDGRGGIVGISASLVDAKTYASRVAVSPEDADRAIRAAVAAKEVTYVEAPRAVAFRDEGQLRVEYVAQLVADEVGYEARVDALTKAPVRLAQPSLGITGEDVPTKAFRFRAYPAIDVVKASPDLARSFQLPIHATKIGNEYYLVGQGTRARSTTITVEKSGGGGIGHPATFAWVSSASADEYIGTFPLTVKLGDRQLPTPYVVDVHHNADLVDAAFRRVVKEGPSKDGVMASMTHANDGIVKERVDDGFDYFHWEDRYVANANQYFPAYDPIMNRVQYGDGGFYDKVQAFVLPTGLPLDVAGHEWTHAYMTRKTRMGFTGMDGAMQETVADAVGKVIALRNLDAVEDSIGSGLFVLPTSAVRSFANPSAHKAPYARLNAAGKLEAGMAAMPSKVADLAIACATKGLVDQGCVHFNAGPGNHAFYLMKQRLKSATKDWLGSLEQVWFYSAGHAVTATSSLPSAKYAALARQQINVARVLGAPIQAAVGCAWEAVGALPPDEVAALGIRCTAPSTERSTAPVEAPSDCGGKADGYYCDAANPFSATLCRGGSIAGAYQCASGATCVSAEPSGQKAQVGSDGTPVCAPVSP